MSVKRDNDHPGATARQRAPAVPPPKASDSLDVMKTRLIYDQLPAFIVISVISAFATVALYWDDPAVPHLHLQTWLGVFIAFMLVRVVVIWQVRNNIIDNPARMRTLVALSAAITGGFWGAATMLFNPELFPGDSEIYYRQALFGALVASQCIAAMACCTSCGSAKARSKASPSMAGSHSPGAITRRLASKAVR